MGLRSAPSHFLAAGLSVMIGCAGLFTRATAMGGKPDDSKDPFITISSFAKAHGFKDPVYTDNAVSLSNRWNAVSLNIDSRRAAVNGVQVMLNAGVVKSGDDWKIEKIDVNRTLNPLLQPLEHLGGRNATVILLDPGHGGTDTGCHGSMNQHEKDISLDITRQVFLDLVLQGYQVLMTRTGDTTLTLDERTKQAADLGADVMVSIHLNSSASSDARGPETYVLALPGYHSTNATPEGEADGRKNTGNEFDDANIILGHAVHRQLVGVTKSDRGLRRARFQVLRDAPCPAVLIECGYLTNAEEEKKLVTAAYREKVAKAIARGVHEFCGQVRRGNLTAPPKPAAKPVPKAASMATPPANPPPQHIPLPVMPAAHRAGHGAPAVFTPARALGAPAPATTAPAFHPPADALDVPANPPASSPPPPPPPVNESAIPGLIPLPPKQLTP